MVSRKADLLVKVGALVALAALCCESARGRVAEERRRTTGREDRTEDARDSGHGRHGLETGRAPSAARALAWTPVLERGPLGPASASAGPGPAPAPGAAGAWHLGSRLMLCDEHEASPVSHHLFSSLHDLRHHRRHTNQATQFSFRKNSADCASTSQSSSAFFTAQHHEISRASSLLVACFTPCCAACCR